MHTRRHTWLMILTLLWGMLAPAHFAGAMGAECVPVDVVAGADVGTCCCNCTAPEQDAPEPSDDDAPLPVDCDCPVCQLSAPLGLAILVAPRPVLSRGPCEVLHGAEPSEPPAVARRGLIRPPRS